MISISLNDQVSPRLRALERLLPSRPLMAAIGVASERVLRDHFGRREQEPNKMGWPSQHIWARIMRSTALDQGSISDTSVKVVVSDPVFAMKVNGGLVVPKGTSHRTGRPLRFLAIPMDAEAYGESPKNRDDLRFAIDSQLGPVLLKAEGTLLRRGRTKGQKVLKQGKAFGGNILYRLIRRANIPADPKAMPPTEQFLEAAGKVVEKKVRETDAGGQIT